jgi:hypothetical protein
VKIGVERVKNHPPPDPRNEPLAFFGNGGGCFHSSKKTKKSVAFGQPPRILFFVQLINKKQ